MDQASADKSLDEDLKHMPGLEAHAKRQRLEDLVVFDCNWTALQVFTNCATQWRYSPGGYANALDYVAVEAVMRMMGITGKERRDTFERVRVIEYAALNAMAKLRERNGR